MPKISLIIFILELYTQIGIIGNSVSIGSVIDILSSVNSTHTNLLENVIPAQLSLNTIPVLKNLLLLSSLISLIIGTVVGLAQTRIKRLLAYSTISHIGFILLALAINTEQSIDSLIFYILQYSVTNLNTFLILIAIGYVLNNSIKNNSTLTYSAHKDRGSELDIKYISELKGQFFSNPLLSLSLSICLFSMAGIGKCLLSWRSEPWPNTAVTIPLPLLSFFHSYPTFEPSPRLPWHWHLPFSIAAECVKGKDEGLAYA